MKKELVFKTKTFRKIPNPNLTKTSEKGEDTPEMYIMICDVKDIPDDIPMETNPREQNTNTMVAKRIKESLLSPAEHDFYLLNRGLVLSADSVVFNNKKNEAIVTFSNTDVHGDIDGGHTYKIIKDNKDKLDYGDQFVKIEVLTNVDDIFQNLAAARNTSTQVDDKSIAELEDKFDIVKTALREELFIDDIYFKQNAAGTIDGSDVIAILNMFDLSRYSSQNDVAVASYNAKNSCIKRYIKVYDQYQTTSKNPYVKMKHIMPDIFKLYDQLELKMKEYYQTATDKKGKFGLIAGITYKRGAFSTKFYKNKNDYNIPNGFIYPILGAFRALLIEDSDGYYKWIKDPLKVLDEIGPTIVSNVIEQSRELGNNPNATGKNKTIWSNIYMNVKLAALGI